MMKTFCTMAVLLLLLTMHGKAQFIRAGKIEFERRTNQHSMLEEENMWDNMIKDQLPKFAVTYYDLYFNEGKSLYREGREPENKMIHWSINYITNTVYRELDKDIRISKKNLFGSEYLVTDSVLKIDWRITAEPRTIAGFECRKAIGKIFDSVVVIAFYSDEIIPSAGPESFSGLPGMILGLAIPRLHTTWYATKLEVIDPAAQLVPPKEGKKYNGSQFKKELTEMLKTNEWLKKISWQTLI